MVKGWYVGPKNESAQAINDELRNVKDQMDTAFKYFEAMDTVPSVADIQKKLGYFRWFLNWATEKGYNTNRAYKIFPPHP